MTVQRSTMNQYLDSNFPPSARRPPMEKLNEFEFVQLVPDVATHHVPGIMEAVASVSPPVLAICEADNLVGLKVFVSRQPLPQKPVSEQSIWDSLYEKAIKIKSYTYSTEGNEIVYIVNVYEKI